MATTRPLRLVLTDQAPPPRLATTPSSHHLTSHPKDNVEALQVSLYYERHVIHVRQDETLKGPLTFGRGHCRLPKTTSPRNNLTNTFRKLPTEVRFTVLSILFISLSEVLMEARQQEARWANAWIPSSTASQPPSSQVTCRASKQVALSST